MAFFSSRFAITLLLVWPCCGTPIYAQQIEQSTEIDPPSTITSTEISHIETLKVPRITDIKVEKIEAPSVRNTSPLVRKPQSMTDIRLLAAANMLRRDPAVLGVVGSARLDLQALDLGDRETILVQTSSAGIAPGKGIMMHADADNKGDVFVLHINPGDQGAKSFVIAMDVSAAERMDNIDLVYLPFEAGPGALENGWVDMTSPQTRMMGHQQSVTLGKSKRETVYITIPAPSAGHRTGIIVNKARIPLNIHSIDVSTVK